jgi:hypothetical protein
MTERQRVQLRELADKLQRLENLNQRLEAANARLVLSNARMASAILTLTVVIDGLLPHIVGDNADIIAKLGAANQEARRAAVEAALELGHDDTQSSNLLDAVRQGTHPLAASTHCKRGHEFTPENTALDSSGWRHCRECSRVRQRKGGIPAPQLHALKTHCPQGHPYDEANTFIKPSDGGRECRVCRLAHQRARRERLRAAGLPVT